MQVTFNGRSLAGLERGVGRAFTGPLDLVKGTNVLLVKSGPESRKITFEYVQGGVSLPR